ncbi:MAG: HAD-IB family phosphatase, partial [Burkholderiales bacterium]|nr:HAD-IB family phosphatase [Burkholderiales bacterium]
MATPRPALALFDLDHTLIPFDSGMAWTRFLIRAGALEAAAEARYLGWAHAYVAGTLDMRAMHRSTIAPLAGVEPARLQGWLGDFEAEIAPRLPAAAHELVARHREAGALCAIVTATSRLIATPFARAFGIEHLLATETRFVEGRPDGEIDGEPCYREHKTAHVQAWLAARGTAL